MSFTFESFKEKLLFFKRWIENPRRTGALGPSSAALSRLMAQKALEEIKTDQEYVLELGAGTGPFTQAMLDAGLAPQRLIAIEMDPQFHTYLEKRFPLISTICGDASQLSNLLPPAVVGQVAVVVSGIPMMNLSSQVCQQIVNESFRVLRPGGKMLQFTYSPFSSIHAKALQLEKERVKLVLGNWPPATVWAYRRLRPA